MCTVESCTTRYRFVMEELLGMPCRVTTDERTHRLIFELGSLWCTIPIRAPYDPELAVVECCLPHPPGLDAGALIRCAHRVTERVLLCQVVVRDDHVVLRTASVAAAADLLPSEAQLAAVLPRLRGALQTALTAWHEETSFEQVLAGSEDTPISDDTEGR